MIDGRTLYERVYCARGEMENRIKEQQLDLFADRTSAATMRANQLRLWFASFAYVLLEALRRIGLRHTQFQDATCGTIRLKLLKLGARVTVSVRRIKVAIASACPYRTEFALAHLRLATWTGPPARPRRGLSRSRLPSTRRLCPAALKRARAPLHPALATCQARCWSSSRPKRAAHPATEPDRGPIAPQRPKRYLSVRNPGFCNRAADVNPAPLGDVASRGSCFCSWSALGRHMMRSDGADEPI